MGPLDQGEGLERSPEPFIGGCFTEVDFDVLGRRANRRRQEERARVWFWVSLAVCIPGTFFSVWLFVYMAMHGLLR